MEFSVSVVHAKCVFHKLCSPFILVYHSYRQQNNISFIFVNKLVHSVQMAFFYYLPANIIVLSQVIVSLLKMALFALIHASVMKFIEYKQTKTTSYTLVVFSHSSFEHWWVWDSNNAASYTWNCQLHTLKLI